MKYLRPIPGAAGIGSTSPESKEREIDPGRLSPRIASLPVDLVRHDVIMSRAPAPDGTLVEIVDRVFVPLVLAGRPQQKGRA